LALVYVTVAMVAMFAVGSLALDYAHVQNVKTELRRCADASARAAIQAIPLGITATQNAAVSVAASNTADGSAVVLDPSTTGSNADIEFGTWSTSARTFTVLSGTARSSANAIRVTTRRTTARSTAVQLALASLVGVNTCDVSAVAIALTTSRDPGITGINSIAIHANLLVASYNSSVTTSPTPATSSGNGMLASNGTIGSGAVSGNTLSGTAIVGSGGSVNSNLTASSTTSLSSTIPTPADPTFTPVTNPGGVSATPSVSGSVTWPGGTYYFTSLTMSNNATINFSDAAVVYLNGNATLNDYDSIYAYNSIPANLTVYQATGKSFTCHDHDNLIMCYQGGGASFTAHDDFFFAGSLVAQTLTFHDRCDVYYDESLGPGTSTTVISLVK
jgi:hypothetical protein